MFEQNGTMKLHTRLDICSNVSFSGYSDAGSLKTVERFCGSLVHAHRIANSPRAEKFRGVVKSNHRRHVRTKICMHRSDRIISRWNSLSIHWFQAATFYLNKHSESIASRAIENKKKPAKNNNCIFHQNPKILLQQKFNLKGLVTRLLNIEKLKNAKSILDLSKEILKF